MRPVPHRVRLLAFAVAVVGISSSLVAAPPNIAVLMERAAMLDGRVSNGEQVQVDLLNPAYREHLDRTAAPAGFPPELVDWVPHEGNPLFAGTGTGTWDDHIRERGFILREGDLWRLWYTGYDPARGGTMALGYATSPDGLRFTRHAANPVFDELWTEDVFVLPHAGGYEMFAEGRNDISHRLTSADGVRWQEQGSLGSRCRPAPTGRPRSSSRAGPSTSSTSARTRGSGSPHPPIGARGRTSVTSR